ncbi:MAG: lysophospholipid acyltransferase family protein [Rhodospirillaceae bacterium]|nr:lysophospholipid acyltransferase family protein [Rhodospirillaceae bacterium]MDD9996502.1 lysophospholipid acyltransferase family protein [Rhodospirillaceae bacterium]MDE0361720.1 lysophospholipid acyltransferase family protein [Rhodospirillaceae bacterium]
MSRLRQAAGSVAFTVYLFVSVVPYSCWVLLTAPLTPRDHAWRVARSWAGTVIALLRIFCGLKHRVEGAEHLPQQPAVVLMKHSSAWETIAQLILFPKQVWVMKRQLLWVPFFGWALAVFSPIAIDRRGGRQAVEQVLRQGQQRLEENRWVIIFPEGTRVASGERRRYGLSGALLAALTELPVIPVTHNAGDFWPRRGLMKRPGTIRMVIGPPIEAAGRSPRDVNRDVESWIETTLESIRQQDDQESP